MRSETDDGTLLQGTKSLQFVGVTSTTASLKDNKKWSYSTSLKVKSSLEAKNEGKKFDCFNLFYNNYCSERNLSKSTLPIPVSIWISRLKSDHNSQHHPEIAISYSCANALPLIFEKPRKQSLTCQK